jgi:tetratricopeptide (TPR) repeat protein
LLPSAGSLVLVTSRSELSGLEIRDGARRLNVGELPASEATELVGEVIGADRATAEPHAVAELVTLCGRLPLALVIAAQQAARYPDTPIADLVTDLRASGSRLDLLGDPDDPTVDPRAVFSWSYRALDADTARAFRHLGLHPTAEINLPAASVLLRTSAEKTRLLLDRLVSVHLLERHQRGWYRFHDLLQVYAVELATAEDPTADLHDARSRILDWYLHTSLQARVRAFTQVALEVPAPDDDFVRPQEFSDVAAATAWYIRNRETLLATVEYAAEHRFDRHGWQLAFLLRHFHETQRHGNDGRRAAEVALQCAERSTQDTAVAYATHTMGAALNALRHYDTAEQLQLKALSISERIGDHALTAAASVSIGLSYARSGQESEAIHWLEQGVAAAHDSPSRAHALLNLGAVEGMSGKLDRSLSHSAEALTLYRELETPYYQAFVLGNMAEAAWENGSAADGLAFADEALELLGIIEDQVTLTETLLVRGRILVELGRPADARETWQRALRIFARNGNPRAGSVSDLLATLPAES